MTTQTEALNLALKALEDLIKKTSGQSIYSFMETERRIAMSACVGIKEALAQQEGQSNYCLQCEALSRELTALKAQQSNEQVERALKKMTAHRAIYFMERFKHEEKLLGPNEQAALDFVIAMLESHPPVPTAQTDRK